MKRTEFIQKSFQGLLGLALLEAVSTNVFGAEKLTVQQIIDTILKNYAGEPIKNTNDTIKAGSADMVVTGIVTTMFPTVEVIRKAHDIGANFLIVHEPTYYNGSDNKTLVANNTQVQLKEELLQKLNMTIWRFHDYAHAMRPDFVSYGVVRSVGWTPYYENSPILNIPETSLKSLIQLFKKGLKINHIRYIGNTDKPCKKVALLPGAWGGSRQMSTLVNQKPDVIIVGEAVEWETVEFIRDCQSLGHESALIILGHSVSEEPGMVYFAEWLGKKIPDLKVTHIPSNDPFKWD
ncbi:Nif3-like dinuclear metal center hexameric protein [Emticicia sp. BO119]|uniref:Nif3-like dinuclear metal center hexameric protein n=1 Tax=Emticicia sp. BO119 TaxID=2757768 RepID=UPI0015F00A58|nr:Nif3-like dinuclear metal center hexameric protein [Emticicia sp. BO119]MBA4851269.1 Nif3-like dinuclear metal center hexameric protein [Emticicia sp. BO119]